MDPISMISGAASIGMNIYSIIQERKEQKKQEQYEARQTAMINQSADMSELHSFKSSMGGTTMFAMGGNTDSRLSFYPGEVPIANGVKLLDGLPHEFGGVDKMEHDSSGLHHTEIEAEGGELAIASTEGDLLLSNRIGPMDGIHNSYSEKGLKVGLEKSKYDNKLDQFSRNATRRLDKAMKAVYDEQEAHKEVLQEQQQNEQGTKMALGGNTTWPPNATTDTLLTANGINGTIHSSDLQAQLDAILGTAPSEEDQQWLHDILGINTDPQGILQTSNPIGNMHTTIDPQGILQGSTPQGILQGSSVVGNIHTTNNPQGILNTTNNPQGILNTTNNPQGILQGSTISNPTNPTNTTKDPFDIFSTTKTLERLKNTALTANPAQAAGMVNPVAYTPFRDNYGINQIRTAHPIYPANASDPYLTSVHGNTTLPPPIVDPNAQAPLPSRYLTTQGKFVGQGATVGKNALGKSGGLQSTYPNLTFNATPFIPNSAPAATTNIPAAINNGATVGKSALGKKGTSLSPGMAGLIGAKGKNGQLINPYTSLNTPLGKVGNAKIGSATGGKANGTSDGTSNSKKASKKKSKDVWVDDTTFADKALIGANTIAQGAALYAHYLNKPITTPMAKAALIDPNYRNDADRSSLDRDYSKAMSDLANKGTDLSRMSSTMSALSANKNSAMGQLSEDEYNKRLGNLRQNSQLATQVALQNQQAKAADNAAKTEHDNSVISGASTLASNHFSNMAHLRNEDRRIAQVNAELDVAASDSNSSIEAFQMMEKYKTEDAYKNWLIGKFGDDDDSIQYFLTKYRTK